MSQNVTDNDSSEAFWTVFVSHKTASHQHIYSLVKKLEMLAADQVALGFTLERIDQTEMVCLNGCSHVSTMRKSAQVIIKFDTKIAQI